MRFLVGAGVIVVAIAYLIVTAIRNTAEYYLTVDEVAAREPQLGNQALRVAGRVQPGTIAWDPSTLTLSFAIGSIPPAAASDGGNVQPVAATSRVAFHVVSRGQPKPDMFADNRDVIVEGRLTGAHDIDAQQVLTSCPSKYNAKQNK